MARSPRPPLPKQMPVAVKQPTPAELLKRMRAHLQRFPDDPKGWRDLGNQLSQMQEFDEARQAAEKAAELAPEDPQSWVLLGQIEALASRDPAARKHFERALSLDEATAGAHHGLADVLWRMQNCHAGLPHIERALELNPNNLRAIWSKAQLLAGVYRFEEAIAIQEQLIKQDPRAKFSHLTNLASLKRELGLIHDAEAAYREAITLSPPKDTTAFSNWLTMLHYLPEKSAEELLAACRKWANYYPPDKNAKRPRPSDMSVSRKLRIGMFSDGFRQHPVGAMTTAALEHLVEHGIELFLYTTSSVFDHITQRLHKVAARWTPIQQVKESDLAKMFRDDGIDILFDLSGYNAGTRMSTMIQEPAPILIKWVGGLINTTGLETIDYLITDSVESPPGSDSLYTEKLIRMPDDYICYMPPIRMPEVVSLPALKNGYVTFGCFNNPTKINEVILQRWAGLMQAVPGSRLFLKGAGFGTESMRRRILDILGKHGIDAARVRLEGQSPHQKLLQAYNDVDVGLDPWPYSGGLTTCEALIMGVPVVTLPGPTFAGRHSATHLANVGMPELVVKDWDEYQARVLELVRDLNSLATIRRHLREILLSSVVCDGPRFGKHLATALRAVWQRYVEGKKPAALAFTAEGKPWFEDEDSPMEIASPDVDALPATPATTDSFKFDVQGKIVALDHGGILVQTPVFQTPNRTNALSVIVIDPASRMHDVARLKYDKVLHHHHAHIALGDGEPGVLYTCLNSELSGTLEPLPPAKQLPFMQQPASLLAKLPIGTTRLDRIDGLDRVEWLVLNETHDNKKVLQGAEGLLPGMLVIHIRVLFLDAFKKQNDFTSISKLLVKYGFRLLRLENQRMGGLFADPDLRKTYGKARSQLLTCDAIFIPDDQRLKELDDKQRTKLAFILHTAYRSPDAAHRALQANSEQTAASYLAAQIPAPPAGKAQAGAEPADEAQTLTETETGTGTEAGTKAEAAAAPTVLKGRDVEHTICVGVPVYNEELFLEQTIRSLKEQNADGIKYLISDNASTDRSSEILNDLAAGDERFEIVRQDENIGSVKNWKFLFEESSSEYFMWLGGHDYLSDGYLRGAIQIIGKSPETAMVCGMPYGVMDDNTGLVEPAVYSFSQDSQVVRYMESVAKLANCTILQSLFRRASLNGFEIKGTLSWDHVLISRLLWTGKLAYMSREKYYRRYFAKRETSTEQRMTAGNKAMPRADFYKYYAEDFSKLAQGKLSAAEFKKLKAEIQRILKARFPE